MTAFIPSSSARHINIHPKSMIKHKFIPHALPHHVYNHPSNISTQLQYSHTTAAFTKLPMNRSFQLLFTFILGGLFFSTALSMVTAFFVIGKENIFRGWSIAKVRFMYVYLCYHMYTHLVIDSNIYCKCILCSLSFLQS